MTQVDPEGYHAGQRRLLTAEQLAIDAARAAYDQKAIDVTVMDMRDTLSITDFFVIASGRNERQVRRVQESVEERLREDGIKPVRREGVRFGRWILLDYIDVVVHVFMEEDRAFYDLERLWGNVSVLDWRVAGSDEGVTPRA
jgi:ribosome-associated protein